MQKLISFKKSFFFRAFSGRSGAAGNTVTSLASERLNFFNDVVNQRNVVANSNSPLPADLNSLPLISHSSLATTNTHVTVSDFSSRFWSYRRYYETPSSVQNSNPIVVQNTVTRVPSEYTQSLIVNSTMSSPLSTITKKSDGTPIDTLVRPNTPLYHVDGGEVGGLYENAVVIPVPKDVLTPEHPGVRELGNLMDLYINERRKFRSILNRPHLYEEELSILKPLQEALKNTNGFEFEALKGYQTAVQANPLRITGFDFRSLTSVLNLFSTDGLKQIKMIFRPLLESSPTNELFSAFLLFTISFTGLWTMVLPVVDLALIPMGVFCNRLLFRVNEILSERSLRSLSVLINTTNNPALSPSDDKTKLHLAIDMSTEGYKNFVDSRPVNTVSRRIYKFVFEDCVAFVRKNVYYFVVIGIGIVCVFTFTSTGILVVNFFKSFSPPAQPINITINPQPLNQLMDSKELQAIVKKALAETKTDDIVDVGSHFFLENFDRISNTIDAISSFLLNHFQ